MGESTAKRKNQRTPVPIGTGAVLGDMAREVRESVGRRAYEFYAARGYQDGRDLEDWLRAETELTGIEAQIIDAEGQMTIQVPLDNLAGTDVQLGAGRNHVVITARDASNDNPGQPVRAGSIRAATSINLPAEIDPTRAEASTDGRTLMIVLPKLPGGSSADAES
jgi:HSP20 family molecular chaperone IbpA